MDAQLIPRKRKPTTVSDDDNDVPQDTQPVGSLKKLRLSSPNPIVLDDFETEAKREIEASAGLAGSVEAGGARLELRHQVRERKKKNHNLYLFSRCDIK